MKNTKRRPRPSSRILIRRAKPSDAAIIARFNAAMGTETEGILLDRKKLNRGVKAILSDPMKGFYLVAEVDGTIAGQMMITREWSDWRNGFFWWIQSVYVLPAYRRRGVYRALHESVVAQGRKRRDVCGIRLYVDHQNLPAQKAYKQLGMKRSNYEIFEHDFVLRRDE
jgi:ribosomal protein S18 acetylase RimI-like enzyme